MYISLSYVTFYMYKWEEFMSLGNDVEDVVIEERMKQQRADQCAAVVFSVS